MQNTSVANALCDSSNIFDPQILSTGLFWTVVLLSKTCAFVRVPQLPHPLQERYEKSH